MARGRAHWATFRSRSLARLVLALFLATLGAPAVETGRKAVTVIHTQVTGRVV